MEELKQARTCYQLAIDTKSRYNPILEIVVKTYKPFCYAVSLVALVNNKTHIIRRWDNIHQRDHVDKFKEDGSKEKHLPVPWEIKKLGDIKKIYNKVVENWEAYIEEFEKRSKKHAEKKRLDRDKKSYRKHKKSRCR